MVESLLLMAEGDAVTEAEVAALFESAPAPVSPTEPVAVAVTAAGANGASLEQAERAAIAQAIRVSGANLAEAARSLGISRSTLYRKMERYGLSA